MSREVTRAEFARMAGVTQMAVTKAMAGPLAAAGVAGKRIDADHPLAVEYVARPRKPVRQRGGPKPREVAPPPDSPDDVLAGDGPRQIVSHVVEDVDAIGDLTIREVVKRWGSVTAFKDWLAALKQIELVREKRLSNLEADGRLVPRDAIRTFCFGVIDATWRRLLSDAPKTIAQRVYLLAKTDAPAVDAEAAVREILSAQLRSLKSQASKVFEPDGGS